MHRLRVVVAIVTLVGCGTPGTRPADMSAAEHEQQARREERAAAEHELLYQPYASDGQLGPGCWPSTEGVRTLEPCWTSTANATRFHQEEAQQHRRIAAQHRAASRALRKAEAAACRGLSEADRDTSPFAHREDVVAVAALYGATRTEESQPPALLGASITLRAVPGLTGEYLRKMVRCHLARNAVLGHGRAEVAFCPLAVKRAWAAVEEVDGSFRVDVGSRDAEAAADILRRAQFLRQSPPAKPDAE